VHYYGYWDLGSDRYPPITLDEVPDYPAQLAMANPERLSQGLIIVSSRLSASTNESPLSAYRGPFPTALLPQPTSLVRFG
jgi:hypothetical protein